MTEQSCASHSEGLSHEIHSIITIIITEHVLHVLDSVVTLTNSTIPCLHGAYILVGPSVVVMNQFFLLWGICHTPHRYDPGEGSVPSGKGFEQQGYRKWVW